LNPAALALGEWDAARDYCRRALDHGATLNDLRIKVVGLWRTGATCIYQGAPELGIQYCNEALALGALPYDSAMAKALRGYAKIKLGQVDDGIVNLNEAVAWFESSHLQYARLRYALWLAEGYLRRGDRAGARPLIEEAIETSRAMGYLHVEGMACWLMGEWLAPDAPAVAEPYTETAMGILKRIGARNDLARAMVTRARLSQAAGDVGRARQMLDRAVGIFEALGTLDEPARVEAARAALDRGRPIELLIP
jgi:tetratricopeptide (TPR) repeat protein